MRDTVWPGRVPYCVLQLWVHVITCIRITSYEYDDTHARPSLFRVSTNKYVDSLSDTALQLYTRHARACRLQSTRRACHA